jgi:hypothetical protein
MSDNVIKLTTFNYLWMKTIGLLNCKPDFSISGLRQNVSKFFVIMGSNAFKFKLGSSIL